MSRQRFVEDASVNDALVDLESRLRPFWATLGPALEVTCAAAGASRQVLHGLGAVPDGYLVHLATGALYAVTPERWTEDLAFLTAPVANTFARVQFYLLADRPERI